MPSKTAKQMSNGPPQPRLIVFLVYPGVKLLDLAGPLQVFADAARSGGGLPAYRTRVVSLDGGAIPSDTAVAVHPEDDRYKAPGSPILFGGF